MASDKKVIKTLLKEYGKTYSKETGIKLRNSPAPLFQWLCASKLYSARIGSEIATDAMKELKKRGWTTPKKMKKTTWDQRVKALHKAHYSRYQEKTSTFLGDTAEKMKEKYNGDLRKLREKAGKDPEKEKKLLKKFKGIGNTGVDIFCREAQSVWDELYPYMDKKAAKGAKKLGLPKDADKLSKKVSKKDFPKLVAALVRVDLDKGYKKVKENAG